MKFWHLSFALDQPDTGKWEIFFPSYPKKRRYGENIGWCSFPRLADEVEDCKFLKRLNVLSKTFLSLEDLKNSNHLSWLMCFNQARLINILGVLNRQIHEQQCLNYTVWDLILGAYCGAINYLLRHLEVSVKDDKNVQLTLHYRTHKYYSCHVFSSENHLGACKRLDSHEIGIFFKTGILKRLMEAGQLTALWFIYVLPLKLSREGEKKLSFGESLVCISWCYFSFRVFFHF